MTIEEKLKHLNEIDELVRRMRSSSLDELSEDDLIAMMEVAVHAMKTPAQRNALNKALDFRDAMIELETSAGTAQESIQQINAGIMRMSNE